MARLFFCLVLIAFSFVGYAQQQIKGIVTDEKGQPLEFVNIFIKGSVEGGSSDEEGRFSFTISSEGDILLCAMMLGYATYEQNFHASQLPAEIIIRLKPSDYALKEVQILAGNFNLNGSGKWKTMNPVDIVTVGGSVGDLYNSLNTLPGSQTVGESGKLFVRGGDSREAQTYIDDMHVLSPYTTTGENEPVRGRYSPFMFEGITLSAGGYDPEYSQGLSSVLPLTTKDESPVSKYGVNASTIGAGGGGTYAFTEGSASVNLDYQNMGPYYSVVTDGRDWITPYQKFSGSTQFRYEPTQSGIFKIYGSYDRTWYDQRLNQLPMGMHENNYYLNSTYRQELKKGYQLFAGTAFSYNCLEYTNVRKADDLSKEKEWEVHLKSKLQKRYSSLFKLQIGAESMIRSYELQYRDSFHYKAQADHAINGIYATGNLYLTDKLYLALSSRLEGTTINGNWTYAPRVALNYTWKEISFSAIAGKYTQLPDKEYLLYNNNLSSENCTQYIAGAYHQSYNRVYRVEAYYKDYINLVCYDKGEYNNNGYGTSKGIDLFFHDAALIKRLDYRISYSLNFSERKYQDYPVADIPQYATRHNLSVSLRYDVNFLKSIIGVTNQYASGRPYHNPNSEGWMNGHTPHYNSLNLSWTFLASKKVILFGSVSNMLGRSNIYNYTYSSMPDMNGVYQGKAVRNSADRFFFIGVFITLGGNTAYDVSNF